MKHNKTGKSSNLEDFDSSKMDSQKPVFLSKSLRTILLQDNHLEYYPRILSSKPLFPALKVIQLHGNPIKNDDNERSIEVKGECFVFILLVKLLEF